MVAISFRDDVVLALIEWAEGKTEMPALERTEDNLHMIAGMCLSMLKQHREREIDRELPFETREMIVEKALRDSLAGFCVATDIIDHIGYDGRRLGRVMTLQVKCSDGKIGFCHSPPWRSDPPQEDEFKWVNFPE